MSRLGGAEEIPESHTEELLSEKTDAHLVLWWSPDRRGGRVVVGSSPDVGEAPDKEDTLMFHDGKGFTPRGQTAAPRSSLTKAGHCRAWAHLQGLK